MKIFDRLLLCLIPLNICGMFVSYLSSPLLCLLNAFSISLIIFKLTWFND